MTNIRKNKQMLSTSKDRSAFTLDEVKLLFKELPYDRIGSSIRLLLATGLKPKELLALEPKHISEDGSMITIEQELQVDNTHVSIGPTKTPHGCRRIPVPSILHMQVRELRNTCTNYIWEDRIAKIPCHPSVFRFEYRNALKGVPGTRVLPPYRCRHTYITLIKLTSADDNVVRTIVGHPPSNILETYLHPDEVVLKNTAEVFSKLVSNDNLG